MAQSSSWQTHLPAGRAVDALPIDPQVIFTDARGTHSARIEKRQRKLLEKIAPFITPFLAADEKILLVTTGCSPFGVLEQLTTGWVLVYLKRAVFVVTDRRIFHVPTRSDYAYRHSIAQIQYGDCETISLAWGRLKATYKDGTKEMFLYIPMSERKKLKALLEKRPASPPTGARARVHLCPRCTQVLQRDRYQCPQCRLEFKSYGDAKRISILYPGGGYFYTGHPWLGLGDALVESILILVLIGAGASVIDGEPDAVWGLAFVAGMLAIEKLVSVYHALHFVKEYLPKDKDFRAGGRA